MFTDVYGLCELVNKDGKTYPAWYKGGGEYADVSQFDRSDGVAYFRKNGSSKKEKAEDQFQVTSCGGNIIKLSMPLRVVCLLRKDKANCDDAYAVDNLAIKISDTLELSSGLGTQLNIIESTVTVSEYNTDQYAVLKQEYISPSVSIVNSSYAYFSIDITVDLIYDKTCIEYEVCY